jgi:transglutaminase-like putative cysteine protease
MIFNIVHTTSYEYSAPAIESFTELRVRPRPGYHQEIIAHQTEVNPRVALDEFVDYFGNTVECFSVPFRHKCLTVTSRSTVETIPHKDALSGLDLTVSEAVRLSWPNRRELYDFLMPSRHAPITPELEELSKKLLPSRRSFAEAILSLNQYIFKNFTYMPGVTDIRTPITEVLRKKQGVCQDFAHLMIALIRCAGLPARYVSGYIETEPVMGANGMPLIGATASHAWLEVFIPSGIWLGIDPTNNILEGERHVQLGIGRDYHDVPPLIGVFKGAERQILSVGVSVSRTTGEKVVES